MPRHEEKYIIDYRQYALLRRRCAQLLQPDPHTRHGSYVITSLYYDDHMDTGLSEKLDGLADHRKFRARTYNCDGSFIRLERKDKHGILTEKASAPITRQQLGLLDGTATCLEGFSGDACDLAAEMKTRHMRPAVTVRYHRDAFLYPGSDLRLTFDTDLRALPPREEALFDPGISGLPALDGGQVIMEIKYGSFVPTFVRRLTAVSCTQLSVSKYALCRDVLP